MQPGSRGHRTALQSWPASGERQVHAPHRHSDRINTTASFPVQMLWMSGVGSQMFAPKPGQLLIAQQRGWKTDNVLAFLLDQRAQVARVEWAGHNMDMAETEVYVEQRRTMDLRGSMAHRRHKLKRRDTRRRMPGRKHKRRRRKAPRGAINTRK